MNDICGYKKSNAGDGCAEQGLSRGNGHPIVRNEICEPADCQLDKWNTNGRKNLEQPIIKQAGGVLLGKNLPLIYVRKYTAQEPEGQYDGDCMDSIHERKPNLGGPVNLVRIACPHTNVITHVDRQAAGMGAMMFFCINCAFKIFCAGMKGEGLTPHKAEDCA